MPAKTVSAALALVLTLAVVGSAAAAKRGDRTPPTTPTNLRVAVGAGIDRDFVYGTASGENTFTVKAVDRAGNTSEASNAATDVC
jgi:predicted outer membrane protein